MVSIAMAMLMAACSQENVEGNQESQGLITFSVPEMQWNKANTRAQVLGSIEDLKASTTDIRVTAKYHDDHSKVYINNERLQYLDNTWTLSKYVDNAWIATKYYWLPNTSLDFFADVVSGNRTAFNNQVSNSTNYTFDYTVPTTIANQHDYVYAVSLNTLKSDNPIPLDFRHALSQVVFTASVAENWKVTIHSITIHNIKNSGTFSYETQGWTLSGNAQYNYTFPLGTDKVFSEASASERLLAANDERLVLMPQAITPWNPETETIAQANSNHHSYVSISCKIQNNANGAYYAGNSGANDWGTIYAPISVPSSDASEVNTWKPNKKYIYELPFGAGYKDDGKKTIDQITLSATIVNWGAGESKDGFAQFE